MSATRNKKKHAGNYRQERLENIHMNTINKYIEKRRTTTRFFPETVCCPGEWVIRSCPITVAT
jgi:hypothetical protein